MALVGVIRRNPNPPGVDLQQWRNILAADPRLKRPLTRDIVNPFTGLPAVHVPPDTDATIHEHESSIGAITVADSDPGELDVWAADGHHNDVHVIARTIAAELGAVYEPLPSV